MLPLLFIADKTNYSGYMPVYIVMLEQLPEEVRRSFEQGSFNVKLSKGSFNEVCMDYCLETTENKDLKSSGGIIRIARKGDTQAKWFVNCPMNSAYSKAFLDQMMQVNKEERHGSPAFERR